METFGDKNLPKISRKFYCNFCDYGTSKKSSFAEHLLTDKHKKQAFGDGLLTKVPAFLPFLPFLNFNCEKCSKQYQSRNGLWKHKKKCSENIEQMNDCETELSDKELIKILIKQNNKLMDVIQSGTNNTNNSNNINNTNNSNNKTFNLQFYLNETCKNAMNIADFVNSIKPQISDLEATGRLGYVEGVSNIILNNLKSIDSRERPIHCSDYKREIIYIKDNNEWTKETEDKPILTNAIKIIANENIKNISEWKKEHPNCTNSDSKQNNLYLKIVSNSMSGSSAEESYKNITKIINNVAKQVIIDKTINKIETI
jgi:hypothetical protein